MGRNINRLSFGCGFRHCLRAASPSDDFRCGGNLGFAGSAVFTRLVITHANILPSLRSRVPPGYSFTAARNALLPFVDFIEEARKILAVRKLMGCRGAVDASIFPSSTKEG